VGQTDTDYNARLPRIEGQRLRAKQTSAPLFERIINVVG